MKALSIVYDPERQGESEEDVRDDQVERVQSGGVELLLVGSDDVEGQAVTEQPHEKHNAVDKRYEDASIFPVVIEGLTGGIAGWDCHVLRIHHLGFGTRNCKKGSKTKTSVKLDCVNVL